LVATHDPRSSISGMRLALILPNCSRLSTMAVRLGSYNDECAELAHS
jgi:hypothetical protein